MHTHRYKLPTKSVGANHKRDQTGGVAGFEPGTYCVSDFIFSSLIIAQFVTTQNPHAMQRPCLPRPPNRYHIRGDNSVGPIP